MANNLLADDLINGLGGPRPSTQENSLAHDLIRGLNPSHRWDKYGNEPVKFVEDVIGVQILPWQADVLDAIAEYSRVAVRSGNGVGKSSLGAFSLLWFLATRPYSKVPTTSRTGRQVSEILWSEISKFFGKAISMHESFMLQSVAIRHRDFSKSWFAIGFSTDEAARTEGWHGNNLLWILDEARGIEAPIWEGVASTLTGPENKVLALSVPGAAVGEFHKCFTRLRDSWKTFVVPAAKKIQVNGQFTYVPAVPLVSQASINDRLRDWGEDSGLFQSRVMGEFIKQSDDTLIPLDWIEQSVERGKQAQIPFASKVIGVDVARFGGCETVFAVRAGRTILPLLTHQHQNTMQTAGQVASLAHEQDAERIVVDSVGVGSGVADRLREVVSIPVDAVNVGESPNDSERFTNLRAELWWALRDSLDPSNPEALSLPDDETLMAQLSAIQYRHTSAGKIQVETKDEMRKRGLPSPDRADAVVLTLAQPSSEGLVFGNTQVPTINSDEYEWDLRDPESDFEIS